MTIPTNSIEGIGLGPVSDAAALPPLDGLLAQNAQATADFKAAVEQFQLAMEELPSPVAEAPVAEIPVAETRVAETRVAEVSAAGVPHVDAKGLPLPKAADIEETVDGADVAAPQALPVVEVVLPEPTARIEAEDGAGAVRGVGGVRSVGAVGSQELIGIAEAVADRVLVSQGLMRGEGEVRILLKPDVLQGTEIRVASESGTVTVNFIPATPEIAALLERNQPLILQHLATHVSSVRFGVSVVRNLRNRENA